MADVGRKLDIPVNKIRKAKYKIRLNISCMKTIYIRQQDGKRMRRATI